MTCPYCNCQSVPPAPPGGAAVCPLCGEVVAGTGPAAPPPAEPTTGKLRVAALIWLLVATAAVLTWLALPTRRPSPPESPPPTGPVTWPPSTVPLLAHLPPDAGIAFAVQPGPLLAHCTRTNADPRKLLTDLDVPDRVFATLDEIGLPLDRLDQLAGGLSLPADSAIPRVVVAVKPSAPLDLPAKLKATRDGGQFKATLGGFPVRLVERAGVWVLATDAADLDRPPAAGSGHLPAGLRDSLAQLSPSAFAWVATDAADWADKPAVKAAVLLLKRPELTERLKLGRAAAAGVSLEPGLTAKLAVRADSADKLAAAVAGREVLVGEAEGWVTITARP